MQRHFQTHNYKAGADYFISKKTTLGLALNGSVTPLSFNGLNTTNIYDGKNVLISETRAISGTNDKHENFGINLNFKHVFDSSGKELTADADRITYNNSSTQLFNNMFYSPEGDKISDDEILRGNLPGTIVINSFKTDYTQPLAEGLKFEAGFKTSKVETDNNARYDNLLSSEWVNDTGRSNHFIYTEIIHAGYINFNKKFNKQWSAQAGLRAENTISKGNQAVKNISFDRSYTNLFPTAYISFTPNDNNQYSINYGRRIGRPDYESLNPFYYFLDKYTYEAGNPYLQPQFSHNIEASHSYKNFLTTTIGYNRTTDIIEQVLEQVDSTHTNYVKQSNVGLLNNATFSINANIPVTKWWRSNMYVQGLYNSYSGIVNNAYLQIDGGGFMINFNNSFQVSESLSLELSGFYRSKMLDGATMLADPMTKVNFGASQKVLKNKGTLKLSVQDFMNIQQFNGYTRYQNIDVSVHNKWESRVVNLSFTYRFSKGQGAEHKERNSAQEEKSRVKSN